MQLAIRSGYYKKINVLAIKQGELIKYDPLNEEIEVDLIDDDDIREETPTTGYYAMFEYVDGGFRKSIYWSKEKMMLHADKYSKAFNRRDYERLQRGEIPENELWKYSSFWYKDFDAMAFKTMIRQLISKWGIMSVEMQKAQEHDQGVALVKDNEIVGVDYVDTEDRVNEAIDITPEIEHEEVVKPPERPREKPVKTVEVDPLLG